MVTDEVREPPRFLRTVVHRKYEDHVCVKPFRFLDLAVIEKDRSDQRVSYRPGDDDVPPLVSELNVTTIALSCWFVMRMFERVMMGEEQHGSSHQGVLRGRLRPRPIPIQNRPSRN